MDGAQTADTTTEKVPVGYGRVLENTHGGEGVSEIVRQTIVFADGTMIIMVRQPNGTMKIEKRSR